MCVEGRDAAHLVDQAHKLHGLGLASRTEVLVSFQKNGQIPQTLQR